MKQQFKISGFHCEACTKITSKRIGKIDGVSEVIAELSTGIVTVNANRQLTKDEINNALTGTSYKAI